jgi:hypothetical protein
MGGDAAVHNCSLWRVAEIDSARWYRELVTDEHAAEASKDGWAAGEACAVLLAHVGGRASDASAICGDVATDRDAAASGRLKTSVIARESSRGNEGGGSGVREIGEE